MGVTKSRRSSSDKAIEFEAGTVKERQKTEGRF